MLRLSLPRALVPKSPHRAESQSSLTSVISPPYPSLLHYCCIQKSLQSNKMPPFWTIGCLYGASSVMLGAFGAHGLKKRIADPARIGTTPASPDSNSELTNNSKLGHGSAVPAHSFCGPDLRVCGCAAKHRRYGLAHCGYDYVLREPIPACLGSAKIWKDYGADHANWRIVPYWRLGCACCDEEARHA